jgi:hypothetical protein
MAKHTYTRVEIGSLCERLEARGQSRMMRGQPELCRDLIAAAALLRYGLEAGFPVTSVEVEVNNGWAG